MTTRPLLAIVLAIATPLAAAQTEYVTDSLRLGLHAASDTSDRPFENLISGTALEVLERTTNYAHVRTPEGREGWVKSAYLVDEKPAALRVAELETELEALRAEAASARHARVTAEGEVDRLGKQVAATSDSTGAIEQTLARLQADNERYEARLDAYRGSLPLPWVGGALVVTLAAGFLAGLWWLDALIRRRHGGFRVY
jgi:SH3 domain protein